MMQLAQVLRFAGEFLLVLVVHASFVSASHGIFFPSVHLLHEELFDGDLHGGFQFTQSSGDFHLGRGQVGDAKRALSQHLLDGVGVGLASQGGIRF